MSWEWRIFYSESKDNPWKSNQENMQQIEEKLNDAELDSRPDIYLDLKDPDSGLKVRNPFNKNPKLELKVRQKHLEGIECWEKCMSIQIRYTAGKDEGLENEKIIQYLRNELQNKDFRKSEKSIIAIKNTIEILKNNSPPRVTIEKNRRQFIAIFDKQSAKWKFHEKFAGSDPDSILIEYTNIDIRQSEEQKPKSLITICVEGNNIEYIKKFREDCINVNGGMVMGYPELIMSL